MNPKPGKGNSLRHAQVISQAGMLREAADAQYWHAAPKKPSRQWQRPDSRSQMPMAAHSTSPTTWAVLGAEGSANHGAAFGHVPGSSKPPPAQLRSVTAEHASATITWDVRCAHVGPVKPSAQTQRYRFADDSSHWPFPLQLSENRNNTVWAAGPRPQPHPGQRCLQRERQAWLGLTEAMIWQRFGIAAIRTCPWSSIAVAGYISETGIWRRNQRPHRSERGWRAHTCTGCRLTYS